jgi:hypothetical protein
MINGMCLIKIIQTYYKGSQVEICYRTSRSLFVSTALKILLKQGFVEQVRKYHLVFSHTFSNEFVLSSLQIH